MSETTLLDAHQRLAGTAQDALRDQFITLWEWRRRVAGLYADVRTHEHPAEAWSHWHHERAELFRNHPQSPLSESGVLPSYFAYDATLRFEAGLKAVPANAPRHHLPAGKDGSVALIPFAITDNLAGRLGSELTLYWIDGYGGGVFLPFLDRTSGSSTYDGGRYLLDTIKGADLGQSKDGRVILDFNFAYNPSCAYSDVWVCPLAPLVNRLPVAIEAGEMTPQFLPHPLRT